MKVIKWILVVCSVWLGSSVGLWAQTENAKLSKTLNRAFRVGAEAQIDLTNKYGQVIVDAWDSDSVLVEVEVTAFAGKEENAKRMLERVDFDFAQVQQDLRIETVLDRQQNAITELWNKVTDFSKTVLSENNLHINFRLRVPVRSRLTLNNKFGDVYIDQLEKAHLTVAYGNLKINVLQKNSTIDLRFGSARIKRLSEASLKLNVAEVQIETAEQLEIESLSSTIEAEKIKKIRLNSRNDKIRVKELDGLQGKGYFTRFKIGNLNHYANLVTNFGEIVFETVAAHFSDMKIESKSTDIDILFAKNAYYEIEILDKNGNNTAKNNSKMPNLANGLAQGLNGSNATSENNNSNRRIVGTPNGNKASLVQIKTDGGDLNLRNE